jgi:hypothetical protein
VTAHVTSKRPTVHDGNPPEWLVDCTCGAFHARVVRLEEEADLDIAAHLLAVLLRHQRLARAYATPLPDDGITP